MLARYFIKEAINEMGQELNRSIMEEVKEIKIKLAQLDVNSREALELNQTKKELNKQRIEALELKLVRGGKYDDKK